MRLADPVATAWKAELRLGFERAGERTLLREKASDGPLVVQKPLYPDGERVCHAIVVHPPGGIAGGDQLALNVSVGEGAHALLTTPGAAKWYRSAGPWARQKLLFELDGTLEWLPRETIAFDGALADLECEIRLGSEARYIGWEIVCLGRTGSGERFSRGRMRMNNRIVRDEKLLWVERGEIDGGGALMRSPEPRRLRQMISQPMKRAPSPSSMVVFSPASAPSNTMVSRGSHSSVPATTKSSDCRAQAPAERYHLPAPGVVSKAWLPCAARTSSASSSPPAMPPGGCTTMAWQTSAPSG